MRKCQTCGEYKKSDQFTTRFAMSNICDDCEFAMSQLFYADVKAMDCDACNGSGHAYKNGVYVGHCPVCEGTGVRGGFGDG